MTQLLRCGSVTRFIVATVCLLVIVMGRYSAQTAVAALPGGASSLQETFGDWIVFCHTDEQGADCVAVHQLRDDSGRSLLAVELSLSGTETPMGALLLPFGLSLVHGVTPQIDDGTPWAALTFSTCLPSGCIVPLPRDEQFIADLREGAALGLATHVVGGDQMIFVVSLHGLSAALDRLQALSP